MDSRNEEGNNSGLVRKRIEGNEIADQTVPFRNESKSRDSTVNKWAVNERTSDDEGK